MNRQNFIHRSFDNLNQKLKNISYIKLLIIFFFLIVTIKVIITLFFKTPIIFGDEISYDQKAIGIIKYFNFFYYPEYVLDVLPGYPAIISIAYLFSSDKVIIYHLMLSINCLITSLIIFPSFMIISKYCERKIALLGALVIALLPSVNDYILLLMSENLFTVLFIFSIWFFIESIENPDDIKWFVLFTISVIGLSLTRVMGIAMILGATIAILYTFLIVYSRISLTQVIKDKFCYILLLFIAIGLGFGYIMFIAKINFFEITPGAYSNVLLLNDYHSIFAFIIAFFHEIDYLLLSTGIIGGIAFLALIISLIFLPLKNDNVKDFFYQRRTEIALKSSLIYVAISAICMILMTVIHMRWVQIFVTPFTQNAYQIWGRLIDPIIPALFIFGIIYISIISLSKKPSRTFPILLVLCVCSLLLLTTFPYESLNPQHELASLWILGCFGGLKIQFFVLAILLVINIVCIYLIFYNKINLKYLFVGIIICSIIATIPAYWLWFDNTNRAEALHNPVARYIQKFPINNDKIYIDKDSIDLTNNTASFHFFLLTKFWITDDKIKMISIDNTSSTSENISLMQYKYIISSKSLPYYPLVCAPQGYCLYSTADGLYATKVMMKNGWIGPYDTNTVPDWWISQDGADILIYQNTSQKQNFSFEVNSFYRPRTLLIYKDRLLQMQVLTFPDKYTSILLPNIDSENTSVLTFKVLDGCQKPCEILELNSKDCECYGIRLRNVHFNM